MTARPPRVRPKFEMTTKRSTADVVARVKAALVDEEHGIHGLCLERRIELVPDPERRHFWSPQLTIDLESESVSDSETGGTRIKGRFGPHPHVWTLYMAIHAFGAFGTTGALMFGISQHLAGQAPWALLALPISPILAALVWALAFVGQSLGAEQMYTLRKFFEDAIED